MSTNTKKSHTKQIISFYVWRKSEKDNPKYSRNSKDFFPKLLSIHILTFITSSALSFPFPNSVGIFPVCLSSSMALYKKLVTSICKSTVLKWRFNSLVAISWFETDLSSPRKDGPTWLTKEERPRSFITFSKCLLASCKYFVLLCKSI